MTIGFAIVHHANQYLITEGYEHRGGLAAAVAGFTRILEQHRAAGIPANLHISGTLLEAIAWSQPPFLKYLQRLHGEGLIEFIGGCYGQNVMRFFSYRYNLEQLSEELKLYRAHLGLDPREVRVFWPTERVWETDKMAPVLTDARLPNGGYRHVLLDDRTLLSEHGDNPRGAFDERGEHRAELFHAWVIRHGSGLTALPISTLLRQSVPPASERDWARANAQLEWLAAQDSAGAPFLAIYADDMEKPAGVGWDPAGPERFERFLGWLSKQPHLRPVRLSDWAAESRPAGKRTIEIGTFKELALEFQAGESYDQWFWDDRWKPYREHFWWSQSRVDHLEQLGADAELIELAHKHLLASSWETAWHTPACGAHGEAGSNGDPAPWACAIASHSRHAAVIAEAAYWMRHRDDDAHAYLADIDNDGEGELILKNHSLFAVFTLRWGGRLVFLFSLDGPSGKLVVGNPADDWNLQEELNRCMKSPRNHPGAFTELGYEDDAYEVARLLSNGDHVRVTLRNIQPGSAARGMLKTFSLRQGSDRLEAEYRLPPALGSLEIEFGLSPDYYHLLRYGRRPMRCAVEADAHGWTTDDVAAWVGFDLVRGGVSPRPGAREFGHGKAVSLTAARRMFSLSLGARTLVRAEAPADLAPAEVGGRP